MNGLLIFNPAAGPGRAHEPPYAVREALGPLIGETVVTQGPGDALAAARRAAAEGRNDAVFVAGGDGTVNEVVNGLMTARRGEEPSLPIGFVPLGTQNVLAHELKLPFGDLPALRAIFQAARTRVFDAGRIDARYFLLMAGFGFDAAVVRDVALPVKELFGPAAYAFGALRALTNYRSTSVRLELDGETVASEAFLIIVANAASYAYRQIKMAPFAAPDDGWLDICVFERAPLDRVGFATQIMALMARRHLRDPRVRYYRARRIGIVSDPPIQGQLDGDFFHPTPVQIEIVPRALTFYVP
jgi:YegS/Rv2252/BmrU family lipid kinase